MPLALRIDNLWKCYSAGVRGCSARVWALRGCSLAVHAGECVAIVGAAGSGKTTLVACIRGERKPDAGHLELLLPVLAVDWQEGVELPRRISGTTIVTSRDVASVRSLVD